MNLALQVDKHRLAGRDITLELVQGALQGHRLAGKHHRAVLGSTHAQRTDAIRVTESQQTVTGNERDDGIRALDALVDTTHGSKHISGPERQPACGFFQLMRQHVEQDLGIAFSVDMAMINGKQLGLERLRIGQVAVVDQHQTERRIDIEGLGFLFAEGVACRRVAHLPQAARAGQRPHVAGTKDIAHHALGLVHEKFSIELRDDARCILAAVLQQQQSVINQLVDCRGAHHADDSTHLAILL